MYFAVPKNVLCWILSWRKAWRLFVDHFCSCNDYCFIIVCGNQAICYTNSKCIHTWHIQLCKSCCPGSVKVSRHWFSPYGLLNGTKANVNWQQRSFVNKHILSEIGAFVNNFSYSFLRNAIAHTCLYVLVLFWNTYISLTDENYQYVHI